MSFWVNGVSQNDKTNTRDYTENNTDTYNSNEFDYNEFIEWFNKLADKDLKNTEINRQYIKDLLNDGYTKDDIVNVIEYKVNEWKNSEKMNMYLRFSTLLSPNNFERYLQDAKEFLPSEPQEKRKRKVPLKEKERDPIDEQIHQGKLFLENFPDNEVIKAELKKLEQIRDELNKIDEQIYGGKLFLSEHPDNEAIKKE
ncbi:conserved phage C-terminal domain-containing protein [Ligilactobacillus salivarius]